MCDVKTLGKYEVLAELGRGAMGVVYKARDPKINRMVALKTITTNVADNPDLLQRFYREGQSLGVLQHPNIATIYEMGDEGGIPFIAMEFVDGQSLGEVITRRLPIPLSLKLEYAIQACRAFDYAHKRGIIHRDIKPGNVMLNKVGTVKVVDFGIARVLETSHTKSGIIMGTFAYMPPEVYHGEHADGRSDIFSFGVLLFELLTYSKPFPGESPASLMQSICLQEPRRLREMAPECSLELDSVVERMLLKPVSERVQTMEDLLIDLEPICKNLQAETVIELIAQSRQLIQQEQFSQARDLLRQALQVDFTNAQARALLGKVDTVLKKKLLRPRAQQHVEDAAKLLDGGKLDEAKALASSALEIDSTFEPAKELLEKIQQEFSRAKLVNEKLQAARQRLAEGLLDEVEALLAPILETEPTNRQGLLLREQVLEERSRRQRLCRLMENMQQARVLWTHQKFDECINLLTDLEKEFPEEEDIRRLMETAREDRAEQQRMRTLEEVRNLLAARHYQTCEELLTDLRKQFPSDDEIPKLLGAVREDQARQRKVEVLAEARNLLASRRHEASVALLSELGQEFPNDDEIEKLVKIIREDQEKQRRLQGIVEARNLLAAQRYEDCNALLVGLQEQFPDNDTILGLLETARQGQAQQRKLSGLAEARTLKGSKRYEDAIALLSSLDKDFPKDDEISKLRELVLDDWADQRMLKSLGDARILVASRHYEESIELLLALQKEFPLAKEITKLLATAEQERAEQERQQKLVEARTLLAAQRWEEALALLDSQLAAQPKDAAVLKLKTLVQNEREKQVKSERLKREWEILKELTSKEAYPEAIARAEQLLRDFPGDGDLLRLLEFAREQQAQCERALRLRKTLDEVEDHLKANRYPEAIAAANLGLESFPQNADLNSLLEQADTRRKREQTRQAIEQRVRGIKIKINREEFSDAIRMAEDALATLGPDTDVTQLLSSAQVEITAREKKRDENRKLQSVRTLLESGNLEEATLLLDESVKSQKLDPDDPRVRRLSEDIAAAITVSDRKANPNVPPTPQQSPVREYALWEGPPAPTGLSSPDGSNQQAMAAKASASQTPGLSQPVAPLPPLQSARISIAPAVPDSQPLQPVEPNIGVNLSLPTLEIPTQPAKGKKSSLPPGSAVTGPRVSDRVGDDPSPSPSPDVLLARVKQGKRLTQVPIWKRPAALGVALLGLILLVSSVVRLRSPSQFMIAVRSPTPAAPPSGSAKPVPDQPIVNPPAPPPSGPMDKAKSALWQQEEQLWSRAKAESDGSRFTQAQNDLRKILALPAGGRRKDDARNYLDLVIPQRQHEEQLFAEAQQSLRQNNPSSLQHAADLFGQIIKLGGPRQHESQKLQSDARASLAISSASVASLMDIAGQDLSRSDFRSARQRAMQIQQMGGDSSSLTTKINQAEQNLFGQLVNSKNQLKLRQDESALQSLSNLQTQFQTLAESGGPTANDARREAANVANESKDLTASLAAAAGTASAASAAEKVFQSEFQRCQNLKEGNDLGTLGACRTEFESIARTGGAHTTDAQGLLAAINSKITALGTAAAAAADETPAIREAVRQYASAFEQRDADALRKIWPFMSKAEYDGSKQSFSYASSIHMTLSNEKIEVAPDHATASVTADVSQGYTPKGGKTAMKADHILFHMVKQNETWVIKDRR